MNTRKKIQLDRHLFFPLALALNLVTRLLGKLLRRDHSVRDENVRVIVLSKFVGMGSLIQSTVLLRSLRAQYPAATILYFTLQRNRELCRRLPGVDGVVTFDDSSLFRAALTVLPALWSLARARVDLYFDLEVYSHVASILCTLTLARNRYGFFRHSCEFKQGLYTHLLYLNCFRHIAEAYGQMALLAGAEPDLRLQAPSLTEQEREGAARFLQEGIGARGNGPRPEKLLAVNANASDLLLERRWPPEQFAALLEEMTSAGEGVRVVLIGSPDEREYLERELLARLSPPAQARTALAAGRLSLFETLALLQQCDALLTNDSGPMHFAFALGVPAVTLWGPGLPAHYGPLEGMPARVLYQELYCSPCLYHTEPPPCGGDNQCMQRIRVADVLQAVRELLGLPAAPRPLVVLEPQRVPQAPLGVVLRAD